MDDFVIEDEESISVESSQNLTNERTFRAPTLAFTSGASLDVDPYAFDLDQTEPDAQDEADGDDSALADGDDSTGSFGLSPYRSSRGATTGDSRALSTNGRTKNVITKYGAGQNGSSLRQQARRDLALDSDASSASIDISDSFQESSDISLSTSGTGISSPAKISITKKPTIADAKAAAASRLQAKKTLASPISPPLSASKSVRTPNRGAILSGSSRQPINVDSEVDSSSGGGTSRAFGRVVMGIDALDDDSVPSVKQTNDVSRSGKRITSGLSTEQSQVLQDFGNDENDDEGEEEEDFLEDNQDASASRSNAEDYALGATLAILQSGARVQARYGGGPEWYAGSIVSNNGDGTYSVTYDDGDSEEAVPRHRIRDEASSSTFGVLPSEQNNNLSRSASKSSPRPNITVPNSAKSDERHGRVIMFSEALSDNTTTKLNNQKPFSPPAVNNHVDDVIIDEVPSPVGQLDTPQPNSRAVMSGLSRQSVRSGFSVADTEYSVENFEVEEKATPLLRTTRDFSKTAIPAGASPIPSSQGHMKHRGEIAVQTDDLPTQFPNYPSQHYYSGHPMHHTYYAPPPPPPPPPQPLFQPLGLGTTALSALLSSIRSGTTSAPLLPASQPTGDPIQSATSIYLKTLANSLSAGADKASLKLSNIGSSLDISPSAAAAAAGMHPSIVSALSNYQSVLAASDANFSRQLDLLRSHAARSRATLASASGSAPLAGSPSTTRYVEQHTPYSYSSLEETKRMLASRRAEKAIDINEARRRVALGEL